MRIFIVVSIFCLVSCTPTLPTYTTKITGNAIQVPVSGFINSTINVVNDDLAAYNILLVKESPLAYDAVYLKCSYDSRRLDVTPDMIACPVCHSNFDFDGVAKGGPATTALAKFPTELSADQTTVRINIQSLGL